MPIHKKTKLKIIAQIATLHSHNITLRNHKKSYNQPTTKKYANTTSYNYQPYTIKDNKMANYFNTLNLRQKLDQLGRCRFMDREEFADEANFLKGKKIVIVG
ncbi:TPA: ketol-acid reductoisomerase, partial [Haemophilus influenzae]